jgi:hypothetical protein
MSVSQNFFTRRQNKLDRLSMTNLFSLVYYLVVKPGAYPIGKHLKDAPHVRNKRSSLFNFFKMMKKKVFMPLTISVNVAKRLFLFAEILSE